MKILTLLLIGVVFPSSFLAQTVSVEMKNDHLKTGEKIAFQLNCHVAQDLEITIFSGDCLVVQQKAALSADTHPFEFTENPCKPGKYFILITGRETHVEKEFFIE